MAAGDNGGLVTSTITLPVGEMAPAETRVVLPSTPPRPPENNMSSSTLGSMRSPSKPKVEAWVGRRSCMLLAEFERIICSPDSGIAWGFTINQFFSLFFSATNHDRKF